jgi:hypothetical protein
MVEAVGTVPYSLNVAINEVPRTVALAVRLPMAVGVAVTPMVPEEGVITVE